MVASSPMAAGEGLIYDVKLSSVGPGKVTGSDMIVEEGGMDLAMKLHYLRGIYYFGSQAFEGLTTLDIKEPIFRWLIQFPATCGRFRRNEWGRACIKCNDCGVRFVEAKCSKTLDEWLEMKEGATELEKLLVSNHCIGPELGFSPLVVLQVTKFKCGGMAVGLSWAHVLGDAFSASEYMNSWGKFVAGHDPVQPMNLLAHNQAQHVVSSDPPKVPDDPLSVRRVGPVGDNWINVTTCKMETFSFNVTPTQLSHLESKLSRNDAQLGTFEALSAVIWKFIAKIRGKESEPKVVTICTRSLDNKRNGTSSNNQVVRVVAADSPLAEADPSMLAAMLKNEVSDERHKIEEAMERDGGLPDFIVYGANLTFVNLEQAAFYEFEYRGQKPVSVSFRIDGVGEQGAILVLPGPKDGDGGRTVVAILPENEIVELKSLVARKGGLMEA